MKPIKHVLQNETTVPSAHIAQQVARALRKTSSTPTMAGRAQQRHGIATLFALAALALIALMAALSSESTEVRRNKSRPMPPVAKHFATAEDFLTHARVAGIVGEHALIENSETGSQKYYRKGAEVPGGYVILAIKDDSVELQSKTDSKDTFTIRVGGGGSDAQTAQQPTDDNAKPSRFTIHGEVRDAAGHPIANATVSAFAAKGSVGRDEFGNKFKQTDGAGRYALFVDGEEVLMVSAVLPDGTGLAKSGSWKQDTKVDFLLKEEKLTVITGVVRDLRGNFSERSEIAAYSTTTPRAYASARTDLSGRYELRANFEIKTLRADLHEPGERAPDEPVVMGDSDDRDQSRVRRFVLYREGPYSFGEHAVDFSFKDVKPFTLNVTLLESDGSVCKEKFLVANAFDEFGGQIDTMIVNQGAFSLTTCQPVATFAVGTALFKGPWSGDEKLSLRMPAQFTLKVKVTDEAGTPYPQILVTALSKERYFPWGITASNTDENGMALVVSRDPVDALRIQTGLYSQPSPNDYIHQGPWSDDQTVEVRLPGILTSFSGVVLDKSKTPVPNVAITLTGENGRALKTMVTDQNGKFAIATLFTVHALEISAYRHPDFRRAIYLLLPGPWKEKKSIEIPVEELGGLITINVLDPDGNPLPGARIDCVLANGKKTYFEESTLEKGAYVLQTNVELKSLQVLKQQVVLASLSETIKPGQTVTVRTSQTKVFTLAGVVLDESGAPVGNLYLQPSYSHGESRGSFMTDGQGRFTIRSSEEILSITAPAPGMSSQYPSTTLQGPWKDNASNLEIVLKTGKNFVLSGTVTDSATGKALQYATIDALDADGAVVVSVMADATGAFQIRTVSAVQALQATREEGPVTLTGPGGSIQVGPTVSAIETATVQGPWDKATANIKIAAKELPMSDGGDGNQ